MKLIPEAMAQTEQAPTSNAPPPAPSAAPPAPAPSATPAPVGSKGAPTATTGQPNPEAPPVTLPDLIAQIVPVLVVIGIVYLIVLRPQQRAQKEKVKQLGNVRRGDIVVTSSGLIGKVTKSVDDAEFEIEIAPNVRSRMLRSAIVEVRSKGEPVKDQAPSAKSGRRGDPAPSLRVQNPDSTAIGQAMLRFAKWKIVAILAMTFSAMLVVAPSLLTPSNYEALAARLPDWARPATIVLGLDLQGGSNVMLEVDKPSVLHTLAMNLRDDARRILREEKVATTGGIGQQTRGVQMRIPDAADRAKVIPKLKALAQGYTNRLGAGSPPLEVDDDGDGLVRVVVTDTGLTEKVRRAVDQSIEVIRRRIDALGTREPSIQRQGDDRIIVQVPGLQDPEQLKTILGQTAKLEFRLVAEPGQSPAETEELEQTDQSGKMSIEKQVMVQGEDLTDAQPGFDQRGGEPVVNFRFNIRGAQKFGEVTSKNVGRLFAIVLDNKVISAPRILTPITGGSGQISGHFTVEQANNLSILLRAGALPAKLNIVEERTVGPGLGQDSIDAGKRAAYVGAALVVFYMLITYGVFGIFANLALFVHVVFIFAGLVLLGSTLTLPGIAGIVLTIGMAVDSNVLIYERIREEQHAGRSILASLDAGFNRAFATIVDSNVTMFVAAAILYFLGAGPVRGFAVSLALGILTSIVTAVTMTRMMIAVWYHRARPTRLPI